MEKNTLVSIILPVYNGEKYLSESIESCLNQTYKNIELIIVNDSSTDFTLEISEAYAKKDSRIKIISNKENKKLPVSLNIGHRNALGDFITWTSDDNIYLPNAVEFMVKHLVIYDVDIVYSDFIQINEKGIQTRLFKLDEPEKLLWENIVGASFLYKAKIFEILEGYNEELFMVEDYDFWLRTFMKFNFSHIKKTLYKYRVHDTSLTSEINNKGSEKRKIYESNKLKMFSSVFEKYNFPTELQYLIINYQKAHCVNYKLIIQNFTNFKFFYKSLNVGSYSGHMNYLKDKYIKGVRENSKNQSFTSFIFLIKMFGMYMSVNDYKTAVKILTHKILNK